MCDYLPDDAPRLKVADLARLAAQRALDLQEEGRILVPMLNKSKGLAKNFWGRAWMKNLARCEAGGYALAPGRTLLRHGCVLHVELQPGKIMATVSGIELEEVEISITPLDDEQVEVLSHRCSGQIDSLISLLEGKVNTALLEQICEPEMGLMPEPCDWKMHCTCMDWSEPCVHAAAALYAAGCLLDAAPEQLFMLRGLEPESLLEVPDSKVGDFNAQELTATFGIDIDLN